ncbi:hypothetical protein RCO48_30230 [Peribacillus frigoritolerans]|nr:hypothetical protein [Peribacillus frigoritolerans]
MLGGGAVSVREAVEVQSVLSEMIQWKFNILFLDPIEGLKDVNEIDWGNQGHLYSASTQRCLHLRMDSNSLFYCDTSQQDRNYIEVLTYP